ncbi:hypothetical protein [Neokomagataea tanensis]|uniref:hypothetical protein n=1 Tax=Neokomagataea TaxID=1223423 RepID=UPI0014773698|nr:MULTISPECIES: hypothetical protein [Neokomagataea]
MNDDGKTAPTQQPHAEEEQTHVTTRAQQAQEERRLREAKALRANLMRRKQQQRTRPE